MSHADLCRRSWWSATAPRPSSTKMLKIKTKHKRQGKNTQHRNRRLKKDRRLAKVVFFFSRKMKNQAQHKKRPRPVGGRGTRSQRFASVSSSITQKNKMLVRFLRKSSGARTQKRCKADAADALRGRGVRRQELLTGRKTNAQQQSGDK